MSVARGAGGAGDLIAQRFLEHEVRLGRAATTVPAGIPLCRLRLTPAEAVRAGEILRRYLPTARETDRHLAAVFCLFAAHALQRQHAGGPWTWSTVVAALRQEHPPEEERLRHFVATGLAFWQRPLRRDAGGNRRLLGSLVLEGGIPGALLGRADFALFLRQLQNDIDAFGVTAPEAAESFAADRSTALPPAWRHADTLALAAELLLALRPWRALLPAGIDAAEAVAALNAGHPDWRASLPLDLDDAEAARLIGALLAAARPTHGPLRPLPALCRRALRRAGDGWREGLLVLGPGLLPGALAGGPPFNAAEMPHRVRFRLESGEGREFALAEWHGQGQWRVRPLGAPVVPAPAGLAAAARLVVDGREVASVALPGGEPLSDIPWVLEDDSAEETEAGTLVFVGHGSRTTARARVFLAADPAAGDLRVLSGEARVLGNVLGSARVVHEIRGVAVWRERGEPLGIRLATGGEAARRVELAIDIRPPRWRVLAPLASLGPPRVGSPGGVAAARLVLRPARGGAWVPAAGAAWPTGEVDVALLDGDDILDRRRVLVLPAEADLSVSVRDGRWLGVALRGIPQGAGRIEGAPHARRVPLPDSELLEIEAGEIPPAEITVVTRLGDTDVRHRLRVPLARGAFADSDGRVLAHRELRTLAELDGVAAHTSGREEARGELMAGLSVAEDPVLVGVRLGVATGFLGDLPLGQVRRTLRQLWATARSQDAEIRLEVVQNGIAGRQLRVAAFAHTVAVSRAEGLARLAGADGSAVEPGQALGLAVLDLTQPAAPPRSLPPEGTGWRLPGPEEPGPWLVIGAEGAAGRVRPRVWGHAATAATPTCGLAAVVAIAGWEARAAALDAHLAELAGAPHSEQAVTDWALLDATLAAATRHAPALSFDLLVAAIRAPVLLAHWMLRADEQALPRLAEAEAELPFAWCLVPLRAWLAAGDAFMGKWRPTLGPQLAGQVLERRLEAATALCPPIAAGAWALRERFGLPHAQGQGGLATLCHPFTQEVLVASLPADPGDETWTDAVVSAGDWWNLDAAIRLAAPLFAARRALEGRPPAARLVAAVRFCRHAAEDEFDRTFLQALLLGIAKSPDRAGVNA